MQRILRAAIVFIVGFGGIGLLTALLAGAKVVVAQPASPPTPSPSDLQCRGCHGEKTDVWTFTSGATMTLGVDLAVLDASPHSSQASEAVLCNNCHQNETRYRYPHADNPAQTQAEFSHAVAQNCQDCHYAHSPFHDTEQSEYTPPTCVDCHGSHDVARMDNIQNDMPANCLTCHTDKNNAWALGYVAPLPGFGSGADGYIGSARCKGCHDDKYETWRHTLHARLIQQPSNNGLAVVGNFSHLDPDRNFELKDVEYTIGSRWQQLYMTQTITGSFYILPAAWNVAKREWEAYHQEDWQQREWRQECGSCHVTGLDTQTGTFREFGVGCESCHGPGATHAADPENVKLFAAVDDQVCGACHSRGTSPDGHPYPATYRPGETLSDHFTFTDTSEYVWPDGSAKQNSQQYMDWLLGSEKEESGEVSCTTCHTVHDPGQATGQLQKPTNALCLDCHSDQAALVKHTPFHEAAIAQNEFSCADCHMPLMATSAVQYDIHNHSFLQPNPQASIDHGGVANMPNACNQCHDDAGETPEWAQQTIDFSKANYKPSTISFFGPGPTPTSPPPPTPLAAVGVPKPEHENVDTGLWIRRGMIAVAVVVIVLAAAWGFYKLRARRGKNV